MKTLKFKKAFKLYAIKRRKKIEKINNLFMTSQTSTTKEHHESIQKGSKHASSSLPSGVQVQRELGVAKNCTNDSDKYRRRRGKVFFFIYSLEKRQKVKR